MNNDKALRCSTVCGFLYKCLYRSIILFAPASPPSISSLLLWNETALQRTQQKTPAPASPFLFSCHPAQIAELFLSFSFHSEFMCIDQKAVWPQLRRLKLLSAPVNPMLRLATCCTGRIMSTFLDDAVRTPEAELPCMCLSKRAHCEQRDPGSLTSAPGDGGH